MKKTCELCDYCFRIKSGKYVCENLSNFKLPHKGDTYLDNSCNYWERKKDGAK